MKILLLGEYSGLYKNLKDGLQELGMNVTLAANGDGWKKIPGSDIELYKNDKTTILSKFVDWTVKPCLDKRFEGYDVVQAINPNVFYWMSGVIPFQHIINNNRDFYLNVAGLDFYLYEAWKNKKFDIPYYALDGNPPVTVLYDNKKISSKIMNNNCRFVAKHAKKIIPCIPYEYEIPYCDFENLEKVILLPINYTKIPYEENIVRNGKVVFFHGINRVQEKGSDIITRAMEYIRGKYPNDVECIITKRMEYNKYLETMKRVNVILDQCKGYGYGMNACIAMAMGKIAFSGAEKRMLERMGDAAEKCPIYNIIPDESQIISQMEVIIENKKDIPELGKKARAYIEEYHNYIKIAQQYLDVWSK